MTRSRGDVVAASLVLTSTLYRREQRLRIRCDVRAPKIPVGTWGYAAAIGIEGIEEALVMSRGSVAKNVVSSLKLRFLAGRLHHLLPQIIADA